MPQFTHPMYRELLRSDLEVLRDAECSYTRIAMFAICEAERRLRYDIFALGGMAGEW